jgi:hypothetical protein
LWSVITFFLISDINQSVKMKLSITPILLCIAAVTNTITGAALPNPDAAAATSLDTAPAAGTALEKREVNGANCWKWKNENTAHFLIKTWGPWDQDWGKGLLDNIRGQCWWYNDVWNWQFHFDSGTPPTPGWASFFFLQPDAYYSHCVLDAIWLASNAAGQSIEAATCWQSDKWWP